MRDEGRGTEGRRTKTPRHYVTSSLCHYGAARACRRSPRTILLDELRDQSRSFDVLGEFTEYFAPALQPLGVPADCWTTSKRPSSTRDPGICSAASNSEGLVPANASSLSDTNSFDAPH